ncbi:CPBP family intramembrane metalloprotease [Pseudomonas sp. GD03944]|uniref:CPBP family intramembrane glutamic endopeptidase n=1 Tax=Pseudomonas sp. GD03944 TaxID=2975409 RepID=UPI00244D0FCD|nr:CPBP family intramembrane metalloprotease [Pseudomonas sp. GD03944]MDH1261476.1 CPBP family intramembrane metalloprotease [Pseudomonas sp. GD03944]
MPLHLRLLFPGLGLGMGLALGFIQPLGVVAGVLLIALLLFADKHLPAPLWWVLSLVVGVALAAHLVPGFQPWALSPPLRLSDDAPPYGLRLSWDKLLLGLSLLAWWLSQSHSTRSETGKALGVALLTLLTVPLLALGLGLVGWKPKWPDAEWLMLWLAINLGVTVLAEELLFRGLLQTRLVQWLGPWPGVLLTALLFGAVHAPFSPLFAVIAGIAGLGYGLVFHYSGRLSLAIALHLAVNLLHLLLLSYPLRLPV